MTDAGKTGTVTGTSHVGGGNNRIEILASWLELDGRPLKSTVDFVVLPVDENGMPK